MKSLIASIGVTVVLAVGAIAPQDAPQTALELDRTSISAGESARLTWRVSGGEKIFISEVGEVTSEGSVVVKPLDSTNYTLIAENEFGLSSIGVTLQVLGARGVEDYPARELFSYPRTYDRGTVSFVNFLKGVQQTLQDSMLFTTQGPQGEGQKYWFRTARSERVALRQPTDPGDRISLRRISYLVEVEPTDAKGKTLKYTIKALIEYKKTIEATWRQERKESIYITEIEKLRQSLSRLN